LEERVCSRCGVPKPLTKDFFRRRGGKGKDKDKLRGVCKECMCKVERENNKTEHSKAYRKNYYEEHHEEILGKKKVYYKDNKEEIKYVRFVLNREVNLAKKKTYHSNHKEEEKAYNKEYRARPEVIEREKQRRINEREKNKEYQRQYIQTERGRKLAREKVAKRRALRMKTIATLTTEQWEESLEFFNHECAYCGNKPEEFDKDHVVPLSKGGSYTKQNIIPACEWCNGSKHVKEMEYWYKMQPFFTPERLTKIHKWTGFNEKTNTQQLGMF